MKALARAILSLQAGITRVVGCVRFYSRLPMPILPWETDPHGLPDFRTLPQGLALASIIIALIPASILVGALYAGLSAYIAAALCIASLMFFTGGFHEDGLADVADGFGGGLEREKRLIIMQDSRVGAFGSAALSIVLILRVLTLGDVGLSLTPFQTGAVVLMIAMISRVLGLVPLAVLPAAKPDGFSARVGQPTLKTVLIALSMSIMISLIFAYAFDLPLVNLARAGALAVCVTAFMIWLSWRKIQGQTGDVAGATQQLCEVALCLGLLIAIPH